MPRGGVFSLPAAASSTFFPFYLDFFLHVCDGSPCENRRRHPVKDPDKPGESITVTAAKEEDVINSNFHK
jgi:hypothetical protein